MGAPTAGFSGVAHARQRVGTGPARCGSDLRRAFIHYTHIYGGIDHRWMLNVSRGSEYYPMTCSADGWRVLAMTVHHEGITALA